MSSSSPSEAPSSDHNQEEAPASGSGMKVELDLETILEHCRCSICMGIVKNTRAISACMHRFCKDCIEAWLRAQIENHCPQCRVKFASKRDCKPDPNFDLLLAAMFGDVEEFERRMLEPSAEVLQRAKAVGQQIAEAAYGRPSPPLMHAPRREQQPSSSPQSQQPADATVHVRVARPAADAVAGEAAGAAAAAAGAGPHRTPGGKRPPPPSLGDGKRQKLAGVGDLGHDDDGNTQYRGVRFQGDNWQARTKRNGKELSLGLYNTAEEAGMAYDLDRLQQQGGKAQRLNFPLLRQHYKQILGDFAGLHTPDGLLDFLAVAVQAAVKAARNVPGATAPENTGPAAAAALNPRRPTAPTAAFQLPAAAAALPAGQAVQREQPQQAAPAAARAASPEAESDSDIEEEQPQLSPEEQAQAAAARAQELAVTHSLAAGLVHSTVHVRLEAGSGLTWRMTYLACPLHATVGQLAQAVAAGLEQQHGLPPGSAAVGFAVASDLEATADFDSLCYEDADSGILLLRSNVAIRELLGMLEDRGADLCLEYHGSPSASPTSHAAPAERPLLLTAVNA